MTRVSFIVLGLHVILGLSDEISAKSCPTSGATCGKCLIDVECGHYCSTVGGYIRWCSSNTCPSSVTELDITTCPLGHVRCSECVQSDHVFQSLVSTSGTIASWCTTRENAVTSCTKQLRPSSLNWCAKTESECEMIKQIVTPLLMNIEEAAVTSSGARMKPGCLDYAYSGCNRCLTDTPGCVWGVSTTDSAQACMSAEMCHEDPDYSCYTSKKNCPSEDDSNNRNHLTMSAVILGILIIATIYC